MDKLIKIIEESNCCDLKYLACERIAKAIRDAGYHKDPEKFCYAPMQQQNPPPKRKRIERIDYEGRTMTVGSTGKNSWCEYMSELKDKLNELIDAHNEEG